MATSATDWHAAAHAAEQHILDFIKTAPPLVARDGAAQLYIALVITTPSQFAEIAAQLPLFYQDLTRIARPERPHERALWQWTGWQTPPFSQNPPVLAEGQILCQHLTALDTVP